MQRDKAVMWSTTACAMLKAVQLMHKHQVTTPERSMISVDGVDLNTDSSISSLRAGCNFCISAAGSKQTLLQRVLQHYDKLYPERLKKVAKF
jgi:hypothetical protein